MRNRHHFSAFIEQAIVLILEQLTCIIHRDDTQDRTLLFTKHLPRNNIGVMLHRRDNDFVPCAYELSAIAVHHQVDTFGGATYEYTFASFPRVDEALYLLTCSLIRAGGFLAQVMNTTMDV